MYILYVLSQCSFFVGFYLWICLIFWSSSRWALARFRRYNSGTHSITKRPQITAYRYIQLMTHEEIMQIWICTNIMYCIVGFHICISLIFVSSSRGALARFRYYNFGRHSITKMPTKKLPIGRYNIGHTKQLCTFRYVLSRCTLLQVLIYGLA